MAKDDLSLLPPLSMSGIIDTHQSQAQILLPKVSFTLRLCSSLMQVLWGKKCKACLALMPDEITLPHGPERAMEELAL